MRWVEPERHARSELRDSISTHLRLARLTHELVESAVGTAMPGRLAPPPHAAEVQARLLVKLSPDLRVIEWSARNSYVLQALGIAATVYELAHAVAYIGTSDDRARRWETHTDTARSYPSSRERRRAVRATIEHSLPGHSDMESMIDRQEQLYEVFCMAKHGNPKVLRYFGVAVRGDRVQLYHGPFVAPYVIRQARFVLLKASSLVAGAAAIFARPLLEGAPPRVRMRFDRLDSTVSDLMLRLNAEAERRAT